jgi:predicted DNA-binding antitoxin AbrB/MazE fold protein
MTIKAIYENGVFRPTEPVDLPEKAEVEVLLPADKKESMRRERARKDIMEVLLRRHNSGHHDTAARHNEHQP